MVGSRRCAECRKTFTPAPSARTTQRVCGHGCRAARDRRLVRARRRGAIEEARADERERQRAHRERRTAAGCHAPPSARKPLYSRQEVGRFVDRAFALSRATLVRDLRGILLRIAPAAGHAEGTRGSLSRATLGAQHADTATDSSEKLAPLSRMTLGDRAPP